MANSKKPTHFTLSIGDDGYFAKCFALRGVVEGKNLDPEERLRLLRKESGMLTCAYADSARPFSSMNWRFVDKKGNSNPLPVHLYLHEKGTSKFRFWVRYSCVD